MRLLPTEPLPLYHSWPLFDTARQFDVGQLIDPDLVPPSAVVGAGHWCCDLRDDSLVWSPEVYALFGFPPGARFSRRDALAVYCEESRAIVERLRAYAIRYRRGFTVDLSIRPGGGAIRRFRLIAAPECRDGHVLRIGGLKLALN